jgi:hypothetical protein
MRLRLLKSVILFAGIPVMTGCGGAKTSKSEPGSGGAVSAGGVVGGGGGASGGSGGVALGGGPGSGGDMASGGSVGVGGAAPGGGAYLDGNQPVFACEYTTSVFGNACSWGKPRKYSFILKSLDLDAAIQLCP